MPDPLAASQTPSDLAPDPAAPQAHARSALRRFGTTEAPAPFRLLRAGAWSLRLEGGVVRDLRWGGTEVLRGIAYLLRDVDWGTAPARVDDLQITEHPTHVRVSASMVLSAPDGDWQVTLHIEAQGDGRFVCEARGHGDTPMRTNRCGFVVLHPASVAGCALTVEHTDGRQDHTTFPVLISPGQPVLDIRSLVYPAMAGLTVTCRFDAELPHDPLGKFEMEDQRNWSDASYKTYVGSLLDPWPYTLPAGQPRMQRVSITVDDDRSDAGSPSAAAAAAAAAPTLAAPAFKIGLGAVTRHRMPAIGLGVADPVTTMTPEDLSALDALRPAWLVAEVDAGQPPGALDVTLRRLRSVVERGAARLQLDVTCPQALTPQEAAARMVQACSRSGLWPAAVRPCPTPYLKSYQPQGEWPEVAPLADYARAFAAAFLAVSPGVLTGGGMLTYFTELNRKRPPADGLDFIGHTTNPIVHAADDRSVMQTLETLPQIAASVRALWPGLPYRLGPLSLAMHRNPYGERTADNPDRRRLAMANDDPRHHGAFGAAWLAGVAAVVAHADLDLLALNHSHGTSGPSLRSDLPGAGPGVGVPAWAVQQWLARAEGAAVLDVANVPADVALTVWQHDGLPPHALLANLADAPVQLSLPGTWHALDLSEHRAWTPVDQWRQAAFPLDSSHPLLPYQTLALWANP